MPTDHPLDDASDQRTPLAGGTVLLFPGQGSQVTGMHDLVHAQCPELLSLAERLVGSDPFAGAGSSTRLLQPAIYCSSVAGWLRAHEVDSNLGPVAYAGHSLGEIAALACVGSLSLEDGLRLAVLRGELMEGAAAAAPRGAMMAVLGGQTSEVLELTQELGLTIAADNAPGQLVVAGDLGALSQLEERFDPEIVKCVVLAIRGAFHTPAMLGIVERFEAAVCSHAPRRPRLPVYSSVTAEPFDDIPRRLAEGLTHPVRWRETLLAVADAGAGRYLDMGPGQVLCRLVKRNLGPAPARAIGTWDGTWTAIATQLEAAA